MRLRLSTVEKSHSQAGTLVGRLGTKSDKWEAEFLHRSFRWNYDVILARSGVTCLYALSCILSRGNALPSFRSALELSCLQRTQEVHPTIISLSDKEQYDVGINQSTLIPSEPPLVTGFPLCLAPETRKAHSAVRRGWEDLAFLR